MGLRVEMVEEAFRLFAPSQGVGAGRAVCRFAAAERRCRSLFLRDRRDPSLVLRVGV